MNKAVPLSSVLTLLLIKSSLILSLIFVTYFALR